MRPTRLLPLFAAVAISLLLPGPALAQWRHNGVPVAPAAGTQSTPQVASDGEGGLYVVWADRRD
jgi:hypothetical protein